MAEIHERIHALYHGKERRPSSSALSSWCSQDDTDTESDRDGSLPSLRNASQLHRRSRPGQAYTRCKLQCQPTKMVAPLSAAPVKIPARTHDFGWCDLDDAREARAACACGNNCDQFETDEGDVTSAEPAPEDPSDDMMFDMEL